MTTRADITRALKLLRTFADDVEEDFAVEIEELVADWESGPRDALAAEDTAEAIDTLCREYGYPSPLPPAVQVLTPDGPGRLA